jgi:hypothetical protein
LPRADFPLFAHFLAALGKTWACRSQIIATVSATAEGWFAKRVRKHFTFKTEITP